MGGVNGRGWRRWSRWTLVHLVPADGYMSGGRGLAVSRRDGWEISGEKHVDLNDSLHPFSLPPPPESCRPWSQAERERERYDAVKGPKNSWLKQWMANLASDETTQEVETAGGGSAGVVHARNALKAAFKAGFYDHLWLKKGLRERQQMK